MKIFLVGFMGAGKTTIGKRIAELLQFPFIDLDEAITTELGESISSCFETKGEFFFRQKESYCLKNITEKNIVIATGGGTLCDDGNLSYMNENGLIVYLNCSEESLFKRLSAIPNNRPLLKNILPENLKKYISETLRERKKYYEKSDVIFNEISNDVNQNATAIITEIKPLIYGK